MTHEYISVLRCGRCSHLLEAREHLPSGSLVLERLPTRCPVETCQAGFGNGAGHHVNVSVYRTIHLEAAQEDDGRPARGDLAKCGTHTFATNEAEGGPCERLAGHQGKCRPA